MSQSIEQRMESLRTRVSDLSRRHEDCAEFWAAIDAEMESIKAEARSEADLDTITVRYHDIITEADVLGRLRQPD